MVPPASYTGVVFRLAIATTEKMVTRQARIIHFLLIRIRRYSPAAESVEGRFG
jgi:hypothetical protein